MCNKQEETAEFKAWKKNSEKLRKKIKNLVGEFYKERSADASAKIRVEKLSGTGTFRMRNGGNDYKLVERMKELQKIGLDERLAKYREEMQEFGKFLKDKFFNS